MGYDPDRQHVVSGKVVSQQTGEPLTHVRVTVLDKDLFDDDILGSDRTDEDGRFEVAFSESQYSSETASKWENDPDIYLIIEESDSIGGPVLIGAVEELVSIGGGESYETIDHAFETSVQVEASGEKKIDLGTICVP